MIELKVEAESINDGDTGWEVSLYNKGKFIKTICTCYEEEYANLIAIKLSEGING
jgi:hypothetical protein